MKKIITSILISILLCVGVAPVAKAAEAETSRGVQQISSDTSGNIQLRKTATLENDGTYTIDLEAWATGTTVEITKPLDVVIVMDYSGSTWYAYGTQGIKYNTNTNTIESIITYTSNNTIDSTRTPTDAEIEEITKNLKIRGYYRNVTSYSHYSWDDTHPVWFNEGVLYDYPKTVIGYNQGIGLDPKSSATGINSLKNTGVVELRETRLAAILNSTETFINKLKENGEEKGVVHNVSVISYSGGSGQHYVGTNLYVGTNEYNYGGYVTSSTIDDSQKAESHYDDALQNICTSEGYENVMASLRMQTRQMGNMTNHHLGFEMAKAILDLARKENPDRQQLILFYTDGVSEGDSNTDTNAIKYAYTLKNTNKAEIYSVGLFPGDVDLNIDIDIEKVLAYTSSMYPKAQSMNNSGASVSGGTPDNTKGYYSVASDPNGLNTVLTSISSSSTSSNSSIDETAILKDVISAGFKLTDDSNVTVKTADYKGNQQWAAPSDYVCDITKDVSTNTVEVTGFDYGAQCVSEGLTLSGATGQKLMVNITGIEAKDSISTDTLVDTNANASGIYTSSGKTASFGVPKTMLASKVYVVDYAKPVTLTPTEWCHTSNTAISEHPVLADESPAYSLSEAFGDYGKFQQNPDKTITYTPQSINWNGYDSFYAFGKRDYSVSKVNQESGITTGENLWTKVSVVPANNVYYEDDFITTSTDGTTATGRVGIEYSGKWVVTTATNGNSETANNEVHGGWVSEDSGLSNDTSDTDGSVHKADASTFKSADDVATATFSFSGTGVDVYGRTDSSTGTVSAILKGSYIADDNTTKKITKILTVDTVAESASPDSPYYQIPTVSFGELPYGEYTVTLRATAGAASEGRYTYYLDGIRVYNPLTDDSVYNADERNALFTEVREILLDAASFEASDMKDVEGAVFIDSLKESQKTENTDDGTPTTTTEIGVYREYGPKNEVYLAKGQAIVFRVDKSLNYYIGLKSPTGKETEATVTNDEDVSPILISSSSDLYYKLTPCITDETGGYILIKNTGDELLSVTKLRTAGDSTSTNGIMITSLDEITSYANTFNSRSSVPYEKEEAPDIPDMSDKDNVEIVNPEVNIPEQINTLLQKLISKIFNGFLAWFH